jgi:hypothetical protein
MLDTISEDARILHIDATGCLVKLDKQARDYGQILNYAFYLKNFNNLQSDGTRWHRGKGPKPAKKRRLLAKPSLITLEKVVPNKKVVGFYNKPKSSSTKTVFLNSGRNVKQPIITQEYLNSKKTDSTANNRTQLQLENSIDFYFQNFDYDNINNLNIDIKGMDIDILTPPSVSPSSNNESNMITLDSVVNANTIQHTGSIYENASYELLFKNPKEFTIQVTNEARNLLNSPNGLLNGSIIEAYMHSYSKKSKGILS